MNQFVCNFATVRFLPYRETGEFVNVGVVLSCPAVGYFDFKLVAKAKRPRRVKGFFPELAPNVFASSIGELEQELTQWRSPFGHLYAEGRSTPWARQSAEVFARLLGRKESILHFAYAGSLIADGPEKALADLFDRYVDRRFAKDPLYQETVMQKRLGQFLKEWGLNRAYKRNQRVGGPLFRVRMPFVHFEDGRAAKVIKPLDLDRPETTTIYEHGDAWVQKVRRLQQHGEAQARVIFTVKLPTRSPHADVAGDITRSLDGAGVQVIPFGETDVIRREASI